MDCSPFVQRAAYICQSVLMFELYKLEEATTDLNQRIKHLLHLLKHLAFQEADRKSKVTDKAHAEMLAKMFVRVYRNHLMVLMYFKADQLEIAKIEKVFKIIEFLVSNKERYEGINVQADLEKVLGRNRASLTKND